MATTFTPNYGFDLPAVSDTGWGGIRNQNMTDVDGELFAPRIGQSALAWGATTTVNLASARVFTGTNSQISTIAFSNVPATFPNGAVVPVVECTLVLTNGGAFAVTWPASVTWLGGIAPRLKVAGVDIVELVTRDGGTTWYGAVRVISAGLIYSNGALSTTSTIDASVVSYVLPAGALAASGQALRIKCSGVENGANIGTLHIKFGTQDIVSQAMDAAGGFWTFEATIVRTGAATANLNTLLVYNATPDVVLGSGFINVLTQTLANAVTIDFRATTANGGSPFHYSTITVELLPVP